MFATLDDLRLTLDHCFKTHRFNEIPRYIEPKTAKQREAIEVLKELGL